MTRQQTVGGAGGAAAVLINANRRRMLSENHKRGKNDEKNTRGTSNKMADVGKKR